MTDRKEYIERGALLENLERFAPEHLTRLLRDLISKQPASDVVEAVRCVECNRAIRRTVYDVERLYWCNEHAVRVKPNDYCSYGERKDKTNETSQHI